MSERLYSPANDLTPNFNLLNPSPTAPHTIGLSGYARSGKDTVAGIITRLYGHTQVAFADTLKAYAYDVNPYVAFPTTDKVRLQEVVDRVGWDEAKEIEEVRRLLQEIGNQGRKHFGEKFWIHNAFRKVSVHEPVVISDVRYQNEAAQIQAIGGAVLRIERPGVEAPNGHVSEHDLAHWAFDGRVINDGTLVDLEGEVQRVLGEFDH